MIKFQILSKNWSEERLGFIPEFLTEGAGKAAEQFAVNYAHGGGWNPLQGWKHLGKYKMYYPGDPAMLPGAKAQLGDEVICVYDHAWVCIFQLDGSFEMGRMD